MGFFDFWKTSEVESPWADNSHLETITLADLYGLTPDQMPVNRTSAMSIPSLAKGRNLICSSVARLPLVARKDNGLLSPQPMLLNQLQNGVPNITTLSWAVDAMMFYGRAWFIIESRLTNGQPSALRWVPENKADVENGRLVKAFDKPVKPSDSIRIDAIHEGIISFGKNAIREATLLEKLAAEVGSNPIPHTVLRQKEGADLTKTERDELLAHWRAARSKQGGSVAYLNKAVEADFQGQPAENLLIDGRNQSSLQMARLLSLPAWAVDANVKGQSLSYSNMASRNRELLDAINPYMEAIEQTLSMWFPYGTKIEFDSSELLQDDTKTQYEYLGSAIQSGLLTEDEARKKISLEPKPEIEQEQEKNDEQP